MRFFTPPSSPVTKVAFETSNEDGSFGDETLGMSSSKESPSRISFKGLSILIVSSVSISPPTTLSIEPIYTLPAAPLVCTGEFRELIDAFFMTERMPADVLGVCVVFKTFRCFLCVS